MRTVLRLPERVGVVEASDAEGEVVYAASLPDGPIVVLRDTALTIWQEAVTPTGQLGIVERVAELYGVPVVEVRDAVDACVADLLAQGVLEAVPQG